MAAENQVTDVVSKAVNGVSDTPDNHNLSIESMTLLIHTDRLRHLEKKISNEFLELKKRQDTVTYLHRVTKTINTATNNDEFDCSNNPDIQAMLKKAKDLGADIDDTKFKYNRDERDRLLENLKITADDFSVLNDMQLQTITRLTTERYESYQLARSIMKPHHEDKINKARAIAGK